MSRPIVLIIDDDRDLVKSLAIRLNATGYETVWAACIESALHVAKDTLPHAIILDIGLPEADGFEVLRSLKRRAIFASIPVIMLSARPPWGNETRSRNGGAVAYFQKPADNEELLGVLASAVAGENIGGIDMASADSGQ